MQHFHVMFNQPGFLPEMQPVTADDAFHAVRVMNDFLMEIQGDGDYLDIHTDLDNTLPAEIERDGWTSPHPVDGYIYEIARCESPNCP